MRICPECQTCSELSRCAEDGVATLPLQAIDDPLIGVLIDERYLPLAVLGEGGMGRVYQTWQRATSRMVALKALFARGGLLPTEKATRRFLREARAITRLRSPHTVTVLDAGRLADQQPYLVMELIEGRTLAEVISQEAPLPTEVVRALTEQICLSLEEAHGGGTVHRDLKPGNIMVEDIADGRRFARVLDFGLAKHFDGDEHGHESSDTITQEGALLGTPAYMSPEQIQGVVIGPRADLYALGLVIFEMLTGRRGHEADSVVTLLHLRMNAPPPRLATVLNPSGAEQRAMVQAWDDILARCLALAPEARFATARELRAALEALAPAMASGETLISNQTVSRSLDPVPMAGPSAPNLSSLGITLTSDERRALEMEDGSTSGGTPPMEAPALESATPMPVGGHLNTSRPRTLKLGWAGLAVVLGAALAWWALRGAEPSAPGAGAAPAAVAPAAVALAGPKPASPKPSAIQGPLTWRQITSIPPDRWVTAAVIAPSGRRLAWQDSTGTFIRDLELGEIIEVPSPEPGEAKVVGWTGDDARLLIKLRAAEGPSRLLSVDWRTGGARVVAEGHWGAIDVHPTEPLLVGIHEQDLKIIGLDGQGARTLVEADQATWPQSPRWSPGGDRVAFVRSDRRAARARLEIVGAEGGDPDVLYEADGLTRYAVSGPSLLWMPDHRLVFTRLNAPGQTANNLWSLQLDAAGKAVGEPVQITRTHGLVYHRCSRSADGRRLAFSHIRDGFDAWQISRTPEGWQPAPLNDEAWAIHTSQIIDDGAAALLVSDRGNGRPGIFRQPLTGGTPTTLFLSEDLAWIGHPQITPDGRWLVFWGIDDAHQGIALMRAAVPETGAITRRWATVLPAVPEQRPDIAYALPLNRHFTCGTQGCVYGEVIRDRLTLRVLDVESGPGEVLLTRIATFSPLWALTPDGSKLAVFDWPGGRACYAREDCEIGTPTGRLVVVPMADPTAVQIIREDVAARELIWAPDGQGLFMVGGAGAEAAQWGISYVGLDKQVETVWKTRGNALVGLGVAPDGRRLTVTYQSEDNDIFITEDLVTGSSPTP